VNIDKSAIDKNVVTDSAKELELVLLDLELSTYTHDLDSFYQTLFNKTLMLAKPLEKVFG